MIKFSGKIKNQIQAKIINKRNKQLCALAIIILITCLIAALLIYLISKESNNEFFKILILASITVLIIGMIFIPIKPNKLRFEWLYDITITNNMITVALLNQNVEILSKPITKIKKIVDYGEYYYLFVFRWDASNGVVCQKDLLVEGNLEEFEKLFEGKIIRKINTK